MKFYNSLSKITESFTTISGKEVIMYVCGLTPYDSAHIGHTRTYVAFDSIKRYFISKGYSVYHIQNITDVDDKIIKRAKEAGEDPIKLTERHHREALLLFNELAIIPATVYPKVTEHIPQIISLIQKLIEKKIAYETKTGIYYRVGSFKKYGALSGQKLDEIKAGARIEVDETKENPEDFALWKKTNGEIIEFDSPFGKGRPGWHIECSAMAYAYAKGTLDIHGGARDLIFPHHENEIAQSEPVQGLFSRFWLHTGFLTVDGEKMSKSLGNFITVKDALKQFTPQGLRLFFIQTHYRSPMDYSEEHLRAAEETVERIFNARGLIDEVLENKKDKKNTDFRKITNDQITAIYQALEHDFDTPDAFASFFALIREINVHVMHDLVDTAQLEQLRETFDQILYIFGLVEKKEAVDSKFNEISTLQNWIRDELGFDWEKQADTAEEKLMQIINARDTLRKQKKYKEADQIREKLFEIGVILEDKEKGKRWKFK